MAIQYDPTSPQGAVSASERPVILHFDADGQPVRFAEASSIQVSSLSAVDIYVSSMHVIQEKFLDINGLAVADAGNSYTIYRTHRSIQMVSSVSVWAGGATPSGNFSLLADPDRSAIEGGSPAITITPAVEHGNITTGVAVTSFETDVIPKDHWVAVLINDLTATTREFDIGLYFKDL